MEINHSHEHEHANEASSLKELKMLLRYMVAHNNSHAKELEDLALKLKESNNTEAYTLVMNAIKDYSKGTAKLMCALDELEK